MSKSSTSSGRRNQQSAVVSQSTENVLPFSLLIEKKIHRCCWLLHQSVCIFFIFIQSKNFQFIFSLQIHTRFAQFYIHFIPRIIANKFLLILLIYFHFYYRFLQFSLHFNRNVRTTPKTSILILIFSSSSRCRM